MAPRFFLFKDSHIRAQRFDELEASKGKLVSRVGVRLGAGWVVVTSTPRSGSAPGRDLDGKGTGHAQIRCG